MFDLIGGLPIHPLVVHAAVVLGPLTGLLLLIYVLRPAWRYGLRWPLVAGAVISGASAFVAKESGERLEARVGDPGAHAEWGDRAFMSTGLMMVAALVIVFVLLKARSATVREQEQTVEQSGKRIAAIVLAVLTVGAVWFTMFEAGHSGATQVWKDEVTKAQPASGG